MCPQLLEKSNYLKPSFSTTLHEELQFWFIAHSQKKKHLFIMHAFTCKRLWFHDMSCTNFPLFLRRAINHSILQGIFELFKGSSFMILPSKYQLLEQLQKKCFSVLACERWEARFSEMVLNFWVTAAFLEHRNHWMLISSFKALKRLVQNNFIDFFIAMSLKTIISETLFLWHEKPSCHNDVTCLIGLECCSVLNTKLLVNTGKMSEWLLGGGNANHM